MFKKAKVFLVALVCGLFATALAVQAAFILTAPSLDGLPKLKDGDLVVQTTGALAVMFASHSAYDHIGMIKMTGDGPAVVEAVTPVKETPLAHFLARGEGKRIGIYRIRDLKPDEAEKALAWAKKQYGKPYDPFFLPGKDAFYCSELVYDAFKEGAGVTVGHIEKVGDLAKSGAMEDLIRKLWRDYPPCRDKPGITYEACHDIVMKQELVTPASIVRDPRVETLYSNYISDK